MTAHTENLYETQRQLERESKSLGVERYQRIRAESPESRMGPGRKLVMESIKACAEGISQFIADADTGRPGKRHCAVKWLRPLEPHGVAFIVASICIDEMHSLNRRASSVANAIGAAVQSELNFSAFAQNAPGLHRHLQRKLKPCKSVRHTEAVMRHAIYHASQDDDDWEVVHLGEKDRILIGMKLLEIFVETTGYFAFEVLSHGKLDKELVLQPNPSTLDWLEAAHEGAAFFMPVYLPMVVPPKPWGANPRGGYLELTGVLTRIVRTRNKAYLAEVEQSDLPVVHRALNAVQSTGWRVNKAILGVMQEAWECGGGIGGLPERELLPLPTRPAMLDTDPDYYKEHHADEFKAWKRSTALTYEENARGITKRSAAARKLELAEKFKDFEAIYFPHNLDFRGRVYPVPPLLNPQSDDQGKALLEFATGKPLGAEGAKWLAIHLANTFGVDKVSFEERIAWTHANSERILDSALSPLDGERFWCSADSPWCALAACFEWLGYHLQGEDYVSHTAIALDGSCNGLQNFSALLRDPIGGAATNLVPADKPADIYTEVMQVANRKLHEAALGGDELAIRLDGRLTRSIVKQPVMTLPYGVTKLGMRDQLLSAFRDADIEQDNELATYLANVLWDAIGEVVVAAREAMDWLKATARVVSKSDQPLRWVTPAGFPVLQDYREPAGLRIQPHVGGKRRDIRVVLEGEKLSSRRQSLGISPNFVHSCDASHLMLTTVLAEDNGIHSFAMIHDSFGTHAADTGILAAALRHAFVQQYETPVLQNFLSDVSATLTDEQKVNLPDLPPSGTLPLQAVLDSPYFFA
ncbi:MAG: T3/T7 RNA polymerase [Pseudomonadota bacterium]|nr:T3/T7 RNA polymerase [Pseudomonadota bacterium]